MSATSDISEKLIDGLEIENSCSFMASLENFVDPKEKSFLKPHFDQELKGNQKQENKKQIEEIFEQLKKENPSIKNKVEYSLGVGDSLPKLEVYDVNQGDGTKSLNLNELYKDQVLFIDFFATWCGPCQRPMAHNEVMMKKNGENTWKDKAAILSISLDNDFSVVQKHIEKNDWKSVKNYWVKGAWSSPTIAPFEIKGVPFCVLVDSNHKIIWKGHPASIEVEDSINQIIKNGKLDSEKDNTRSSSSPSSSSSSSSNNNDGDELLNSVLSKNVDPLEKQIEKCFQIILDSTNIKTVKDLNPGGMALVGSLLKSTTKSSTKSEFVFVTRGLLNSDFKKGIDTAIEKIKSSSPIFSNLRNQINYFSYAQEIKKCEKCDACEANLDSNEIQWACCNDCDVSLCDACAFTANHDHKKHIVASIRPNQDLQSLQTMLLGKGELIEWPDNFNGETDKDAPHFRIGCDECGEGIKGNRMKCSHCFDFDLCQACFENWKKSDDEKIHSNNHSFLLVKKPNTKFWK